LTLGLVLGYDRETEVAMCGQDVQDVGMGLDHSAGLVFVRLYLGHGLRGLHKPSAGLSRRDVWTLRLWTRGKAALPARVAAWWLERDLSARDDTRTLLRGLSWLSWLAFWWAAGDGEDVQPDQPGRAEEHRAGV